tara:strand:- start:1142 stop:1579 length:438 start_codon:yes stop_codon:yes gene_type:complete
MIECKLRGLAEFQSVLRSRESEKMKKGFYSYSIIPISGLGRDKWLVIAHINVDYNKYLGEGMSEKEIFHQCVEFLNRVPPRKKYAKKKPKSLYGNLIPYNYKFKEDADGTYIEAELTTDQRKNKNFWREGIKHRKIRMPLKLKSK